MIRRNIILCFALLFFVRTGAQFSHLTFRHLTHSSGLPVEHITALAQDSSGFIWIGSKEGLFRYDGFNFTAFYAQPGNESTLPENIITKIFVTRKGLIWVGTLGGGISCMKQNGKVIKTINSSNNSLVTGLGNHISEIREDEQGNIWWTSIEGLFRFTKEGKLDRYMIPTPVRRGNLFNGFVFGRDGILWLGGFLGLKLFDTRKQAFVESKQHPVLFENKDVSRLIFHGSRLWYSTWVPDLGFYDSISKSGSFLYRKTNDLQPDFMRMSNQFYEDSKGHLWIATGKGLFLVKKNETQVAQSFFSEPGNNYSIISNSVKCILEDREGNVWIGTEHGISITRPYDEPVVNYSLNSLKQSPFGDKPVNNIAKVDNNTFLVGTHYADGVYQTDSNFHVTRHYDFKDVKFNWIWTSYDDKPRNRILISAQQGMLVFDKRSRTLSKNEELMFNDVRPASAFFGVGDSVLWLSKFRNSFIRCNLANGNYKTYELGKLGLEPQVVYLSGGKDGSIWIMAHSSGVFRFDEKSEKFTDSFTVNQSPQSLKQTNVMFFEDLGNYFLVGYQSKGIALFDKAAKKFQHFTQADGLASNNVDAAWCVNDNEVWIATSNGLSFFNARSKTFKNYDYNKGIIAADINCITPLDRGRIAAGTTKGVFVFTPSLVDAFQSLPPPVITGMSIYGKEVPLDSMQGKPIDISYNKNYFSFDYISLQYQNNAEIEYAYKLEGFDKEWIYAGKRRFASYSNIKGGKYFLKVKSRRPGGEWVEGQNPIPLFVHTAFYKQWWFYVLCVLLVSAVVYAIFRYRVRQVLKMERMRAAISSDLHDEVGASLTSISIFSEMARRSAIPSSKEEEYLVRIGDRSRESIEKMGDIIWSINPDNDTLQQMLVRMKNYATEITEATDVLVHWTESGNFAASKLSMEQRKNFYLLFKEVMNNSIKHAGAENIWVDLASTSNVITMSIRDDGRGFDPQLSSKGNGIKNMQRRATALKGKVVIQSEKHKGTRVELKFQY